MCSNKKHLDFSEQTRNNYIQKLKTGSLKNNVFDVFVAGGGITGASVARDCAYKELSIVLAEKSDWASGASSESTKIIHRGVLYLDRAFAFIRKALRSSFKFLTLKSFNRRTLGEIILYWTSARDNLKTCRKLLIESKVIAKMSTQITMQKKVYMVIEKEDKRSIFIMYAGLMLHWIVGGFSLECPKIYFRKKTIQNKFSELNTIIIKGVLTFAEYVTDDTLLTIYTIKDAFYHGAVCIPFLLVKKVEYYSDRNYYAVTVSDTSKNFEHSTNTFKIKARKFINAAGVHVDAIHHRIYDDGVNKKNLYSNLIKPVKGGHVIVRADKIGSTRTYLMSIARTKDGISKIVNEQMNIFVVYRNELGTTGDNYGYYYIDTNDWVEADNRSIEAEIERRQYLFTIKELNK